MSETLYKKIKAYVLNDNHFKPGEALSERKLAERFKVSRSPVREVLNTLEHEGFVNVVPHRGIFRVTLMLEDIREIFELREALDTFAIRRAALTLDQRKVDKLAKRFGRVLKKGDKASFNDVVGAWAELFRVVFKSLNNRRFMKIYSDLFDQVAVVRRFSTGSHRRITEVARLGAELVDALTKRDVDLAESLLRLHRQKSKEAIFEALS